MFDRCFNSLDECFAEVWKANTEILAKGSLEAYQAAGTWRDGMRASAWETCRLILEDPLRARICLVEVNYGGEIVQGTRDLVLSGYVELVHFGRHEHPRGAQVPRAQAEAIVGAVWDRAGRAVAAGDLEAVIDDVPEFLYLTYIPYLGRDIAVAELRRAQEEVSRLRGGRI